ncbi:MAG TPA: hypothetical protein PKA64_05140 [Myxococcota bacterium]|nr:hypothetical protein [Myxococcota bacterium]
MRALPPLLTVVTLSTCAHRAREAPGAPPIHGAALISGRVVLPPVHPMMLFPRRVRGRDHIESGMNQALDEQLCGYLDKEEPRFVYDVKQMEQLRLESLLQVRVTPWDGSGVAFDGTIDDDGRFRVEVPRSLSGYHVTVTGGRVNLAARVRPSALREGHVDDLRVDLVSTALVRLTGAATADTPDEELTAALGPRLPALVEDLRDAMSYGLVAANAAIGQTRPPYYTFRACTSVHPDPACYRRGDPVPHALLSAAQLPPDAATWRPGDDTPPGLLLTPWRPAGSAASSTIDAQTGFVVVQPTSAGGGVDLVFDGGARAFGLTLQNGTTHADTSGTFPRRPFRVTLMDDLGGTIQEYHWYTNQHITAFYGAASGAPIHRVRVEVRSPGAFTLGDVRWSATYPAAVGAALGWTATGNWRLVEGGMEDPAFRHPYYQGYEESFGDQFYNLRERAAESSRGRYWQVPYGETESDDGSALISPAFTLNNLDLDMDDRDGFAWWINGVTHQTQVVELATLGPDGRIYRFHSTGNPTCRIGGIDFLFDETPFPKPTVMPGCRDRSWEGRYVAGMDTHWGHFHFRANIGVPATAQWENVTSGPDRTERYVEYSTDNGASWRPVWWWPDPSHHGMNDVWWKNHGHGMYDSDMVGEDWNGNGARGTDFDKDGVDDYVAPVDNNGNGVIDADPHGDDAREWDTEWYMEYVPPSAWRDVDGDGHIDPDIEGVTIRYRLRFVGPNKPKSCGAGGCFGWMVDDFAINNDNPRVGYYTSFDGAYDANLR